MFIDRTFITQRILPKKFHATIHRLLHPRFLILDHITQITNREPIPFAPKAISVEREVLNVRFSNTSNSPQTDPTNLSQSLLLFKVCIIATGFTIS